MSPRCRRRPSTLRLLYWLCPIKGQPPSQPRIIRLSPAKSYSPLPLEEGSKSLSIRRRLLSRQLLIGETGWQNCCVAQTAALVFRSEEHTSELQSLMRNSYAVFCLKQKIKK